MNYLHRRRRGEIESEFIGVLEVHFEPKLHRNCHHCHCLVGAVEMWHLSVVVEAKVGLVARGETPGELVVVVEVPGILMVAPDYDTPSPVRVALVRHLHFRCSTCKMRDSTPGSVLKRSLALYIAQFEAILGAEVWCSG